jgi:hypothetical protein
MGEQEKATRRWKQINAERAARPCLCGNPWTHVQVFGGNSGSEPVKVYLCDDGRGSRGMTRKEGHMVHTFGHPQPCPYGETLGSVGPANGGPPRTFVCTHRQH